MFDGFDDSSTFVSREIVEAFSLHYGEKGMECANIFGNNTSVDDIEAPESSNSKGSSSSSSGAYGENPWLSWGNSWIHWNCDWRQSLLDTLDLNILEPNVYCKLVGTESGPQDTSFPCIDRPLVFHHREAGDILLRNEAASKIKSDHVCEFMLLIDKVKSSQTMYELWNRAVPHHYHDFSPVFLNDGYDGWKEVIKMFVEEETSCRNWAKRNGIVQNDTTFENDTACVYAYRRRLQHSRKKQAGNALHQLSEVFCPDGAEMEFGYCRISGRKGFLNGRRDGETGRNDINTTLSTVNSRTMSTTTRLATDMNERFWWEEAFDTFEGRAADASAFRLFYNL